MSKSVDPTLLAAKAEMRMADYRPDDLRKARPHTPSACGDGRRISGA